jgi:hypothetical protein
LVCVRGLNVGVCGGGGELSYVTFVRFVMIINYCSNYVALKFSNGLKVRNRDFGLILRSSSTGKRIQSFHDGVLSALTTPTVRHGTVYEGAMVSTYQCGWLR